MKRSFTGFLVGIVALSLIGGVATAEEQNALLSALDSPVKNESATYVDAFVLRSAAYPGLAGFGICEDTSDGTLWVGDLVDGNLYQYSKDLTLLGSLAVPVMAGTTSTGLAYDPTGNGGAGTFWILDIATGTFNEVDKTGTATGNSLATGFGVVGPATIDPGDLPGRIWFQDIAADLVVEMDLLSGLVTNSHINPDNAGGTGAFGNGLSYDADDTFSNPGDLQITSGTITEGQVTRISAGQPSSLPFPRNYSEIWDVTAVSSFINGIQDSIDGGNDVVYMVDNANGFIVEIGEEPAILQCAPGAVNLGGPQAAFLDDMESGQLPHWTVSSTGFGANDWAIISTPNASSGTMAWRVDDEATISSEFLDLTVDIDATNTQLSFFHTFDLENGFDGGVLEISTDGGATFSDIGSTIVGPEGYTGVIDTRFGNPLSGRGAWTGGTLGAMTSVNVDLSSFANTNGAIIRWFHGSDSSVSDVGWEVDDVALADPSDSCSNGPRADVLFVNRLVPSSTLIDDMESGQLPQWTVSSTGFGANDWAIISTPNASSGTMAWRVDDEATISSEFLDLTLDIGAVETTLEFFHTFDLESGFDGGVLEISTDGGSTFSDLGGSITEGGYTGVIDTRFGNPLAARSAWTGGTLGAMTRVEVDLSGFANTNGAIIRWFHGSDSSVADVGWEVDDVSTLSGGGSSGTGDEDFTIELGTADPISVRLDEAPSKVGDAAGSDAVVYAWIGEPDAGDIVNMPKGLGNMCFGTFSIATQAPKKIFNGLGFPGKLGTSCGQCSSPGISEGGNFEVGKRPNGTGQAITATLQGVIDDDCSQGTVPYSVTNGILLKVQ